MTDDRPTFTQYLDAADETARSVALLTGIKTQFVEAGWDDRSAEQATLLMLQGSLSGHGQGRTA